MNRKKISILSAGLIFVICGLWLYLTPYITAYNMKKAAAANDPATLSGYIDFPSLKESMKANVTAMFASEMTDQKSANPFSAFGASMAASFINPMIDSLVTPASLAMLMQGNADSGELKKGGKSEDGMDATMGYDGLNRFALSIKKKGDPNPPVTFILHREGLLTWKLASIKLPKPGKKG